MSRCIPEPWSLKRIEIVWIVYEYTGQSALWLCARLVFGGDRSVGREGEICIDQAVDHSIKQHWDTLRSINSCIPQFIFKDSHPDSFRTSLDVLLQLFRCQTFGFQKMKTFWKSSVSYCVCMGLFSLTVTELKQESFLYDWQEFGKPDTIQKIKKLLFNRPTKT